MFPVKCKDNLPLDHVVINSIAVRGRLGPLTVWVSIEDQRENRLEFRMNPRFWTKIYDKVHKPSFQSFQTLDLSDNPIYMKPGQVRAVYIHSSLPGDEAIVYDNRNHRRTYDDALVSILTGRAHVSPIPFGTTPIWGWGNAWRDQREFVGRIEYGAVYKLWNPSQSHIFGGKFQSMARVLFLCQRRCESPMSRLPDDCIFYILNMCRWDWANDTPGDMKQLKRRRQNQHIAASMAVAAQQAGVPMSETTNPTARSCCARAGIASQDDDADDSSDGEADSQDAIEEDQDDDDDDYEIQDDYGVDNDGDDDDDVEVDDEDDDDDDDNDNDDDDDNDDEDFEDDDAGDEDAAEEEDNDDTVFRYQDYDSDEEPSANGQEHLPNRAAWIRRQFARIHVLQALAQLEDVGVVGRDA